jgi:beta-N-acetylhexosaminidase
MACTSVDLVGQGLMMRFEGTEFSPQALETFEEIRPGGVLLFADNITSREQVHSLVERLQAQAVRLDLPPLLIAADQEGGTVSRFSNDFITMPSPMALAASVDPTDIETAARITGEQLREVGITVNFAPAIDINTNPENPVIRTRAFGDTPGQVIGALARVLRGHEAARVVTTVKHFPGHGDTSVDSHLGLPTISWERERIDRVELAPFRAAIAMGVPAVMSAHIMFPALDSELPATLSERILTGLLRRELGFPGVTFTDSMSMRAITNRYGLVESTILAKLAGVDMLEANESLADQGVRQAALLDALESGRIPAGIFEATADRVAALRDRYGITGKIDALPAHQGGRRRTALEIARRTIAHAGTQPWRPVSRDGATLVVDFQRLRATEAEDQVGRAQVLRGALAGALPGAVVATLSDKPAREEIALAVRRAAESTTLVILTRDAADLRRQVEIADAVIGAAPDSARVVHCPMRGPYDATTLARADDLLFTFGDPAISIEALVDVLAGEHAPAARMPVVVPGLEVA